MDWAGESRTGPKLGFGADVVGESRSSVRVERGQIEINQVVLEHPRPQFQVEELGEMWVRALLLRWLI